MKTVWVYADNEDFYGMAGFCDTKDEAVEEALSDLGDDDGDIFVASAEQIDPMRFCPDAVKYKRACAHNTTLTSQARKPPSRCC